MEWKEYKLGDICDTISDTYKGNASDVVLINTSDVFEGKCLNHTFVPNKNLKGQFKKQFKKNDILYSEIRPANKRYAFIDFEPLYYIASTKLMVIRSNDKVIPQYLYYVLTSAQMLETLQILAESRSGTFPQITFSEVAMQPIALPDINEQYKIVAFLQSLDAKIETNNRLSEKLEELAQAIFKSWFVDFKPFKNGNFVDSELGMIPEGWEVGKIGDLCTFKRGKGLLSKDAILGDVPVVAGGMQPSCYHNVANTQAPVVTVSGSGANAGFTRLYHVNVWASDCSFIDRNCENLYFVYCYLIRNKRLLKHAQTGAVQPHVKPADIHNFETVIPPKDILVQFNSIIEELLSQNGIFEKENQRLTNLRDTILPRLMSGEIKL